MHRVCVYSPCVFPSSGYDMSTFIRRYSRYLNEKSFAYRQMSFDFIRVKKGYGLAPGLCCPYITLVLCGEVGIHMTFWPSRTFTRHMLYMEKTPDSLPTLRRQVTGVYWVDRRMQSGLLLMLVEWTAVFSWQTQGLFVDINWHWIIQTIEYIQNRDETRSVWDRSRDQIHYSG